MTTTTKHRVTLHRSVWGGLDPGQHPTLLNCATTPAILTATSRQEPRSGKRIVSTAKPTACESSASNAETARPTGAGNWRTTKWQKCT